MQQPDQFDRPRPQDDLDRGAGHAPGEVDDVLDRALGGRGAPEDEAASPTYGSITSPETQKEENAADLPETDPFEDR